MKKEEWRFLLYWVLAMLVGDIASHFIYSDLLKFYNSIDSFCSFTYFSSLCSSSIQFLIPVAIFGIPSWIVLRSRFRYPWLWVLFNALVPFGGFILNSINLLDCEWLFATPFNIVPLPSLYEIIGILFFASFQWLSLRLEVNRAYRWFWMKLGIDFILRLYSYVYLIIQQDLLNRTEVSKLSGFIDTLVTGIPGAILIGLALVWLLRDPITYEDELEPEAV